MQTIAAQDGTELYVKDWGQGRPVVLIHGWPLNADSWEYQAVKLAENGHRVIAYDRRGFGRSGQPFTGYDYDTLAGDLAAVIDGLDLSDVALVGFSMGGGEVARYLGRHGSAKVRAAVLVSSVVPYMLKTGDNPGGVDASVFEEMKTGLRNDRPEFLTSFFKDFYGQGLVSGVSDGVLHWSLMMAMQASPKATLDCVDAFARTDFRGRCAPDRRADAGDPRHWRQDGAHRCRRTCGREADPRRATGGTRRRARAYGDTFRRSPGIAGPLPEVTVLENRPRLTMARACSRNGLVATTANFSERRIAANTHCRLQDDMHRVTVGDEEGRSPCARHWRPSVSPRSNLR